MKQHATILSDPFSAELTERLVRYARIATTSNRHIEEIPSTQSQWTLARLLVEELVAMGLEDVDLDDHCYLIARLPASAGYENAPTIGFLAHMDTASDVSGAEVKPRVIKDYDGKAIRLSGDLILDPEANPDLPLHCGDTIIVTDGMTLLGADDKAGIAEIMTALRFLLENPAVVHGPLEIIFTPDEETGKGMNLFPLSTIKSIACYTLDGGRGGEIEAECFTAYEVIARFKGQAIHIGAARGKLANALNMAASFTTMLPRSESPESTDGWYGYYCPVEMSGSIESAKLSVYLRDFSDEGMAARIEACKAFARAVEAQFPGGIVELEIKKLYQNMRKKLDERPEVLAHAMEACRTIGVAPEIKPIRGGTDGARLTELGVPTPNIFTGGYNFHSRFEWASVSEMVQATRLVVELIRRWSEKKG